MHSKKCEGPALRGVKTAGPSLPLPTRGMRVVAVVVAGAEGRRPRRAPLHFGGLKPAAPHLMASHFEADARHRHHLLTRLQPNIVFGGTFSPLQPRVKKFAGAA